jgi:hypothetical protein
MKKRYFSRTQLIIGIVMKFIAIIASIYGIILTSSGMYTFTFFTNLSNVWIDIVLFIFLILDIILLKSNGEKDYRSNALYILKFMMTISISLTFLIYMFILGPTNDGGLLYSYFRNHAGSFCVHFVTPCLAILDFFLFDYDYKSTGMHAVYAVIPPLCYVAFVVLAAGLGLRWYDTMYAPYNFLNFGAQTGWFGFDLSLLGEETLGVGVAYMIVVLLLIFLALGRAYLLIKDLRRKSVYQM